MIKKHYLALANQSGTNAPVVTPGINDHGVDIVWTYITDGEYRGTLAGAFPEGGTFALGTGSCSGSSGTTVQMCWESDDTVLLYSCIGTTPTNDELINATISITSIWNDYFVSNGTNYLTKTGYDGTTPDEAVLMERGIAEALATALGGSSFVGPHPRKPRP